MKFDVLFAAFVFTRAWDAIYLSSTFIYYPLPGCEFLSFDVDPWAVFSSRLSFLLSRNF